MRTSRARNAARETMTDLQVVQPRWSTPCSGYRMYEKTLDQQGREAYHAEDEMQRVAILKVTMTHFHISGSYSVTSPGACMPAVGSMYLLSDGTWM